MNSSGFHPGAPAPDGAVPAHSIPSQGELRDLRRRLSVAVSRACPGWLAQDREDIVQNALVKLIDALGKSEGKREFSSIYLAKAAHGATVDEIRRRCRRKEDAPGEDQMEARSEVANPERESSSREIGRGIQDCMHRLVRPRRLALMLYLQGCTVPETARRLGWDVKRADNLVYRGLRDLRQCLAEKGMKP